MKKSYLMIAAAVLTFAACSENEEISDISSVNDNENVLIGFETFHEKATKATATDAISAPADLTKTHGGFGVWGYKATDAAEASGTPAVVDFSSTTDYTTVFDNVKVWYESASTKTQGFTYTVPKYWDKNKEYIFFAYAPYDENNASIETATGKITIADIASIQNVSTSTGTGEALVYNGSTTTSVTDYLMATYVTNQRLNNTNQSAKSYDGKDQTVGFTFGHMLSKLQVNLQASEAYSGIKSISVNSLSIENMPASASTKASFTQTSPTAPAGVYTPASYTSELILIGTGGTSTSSLYILKNGSLSGETVTAPTAQNQSFNYYVAPNTPSGTGTDKYLLNIAYTVNYVDNTTEEVTINDIDLSGKLASLLQNNSYTLTIKVALNQIFFTVDAVTGWTDQPAQEIEIK